jgi:hypothetical protein
MKRPFSVQLMGKDSSGRLVDRIAGSYQSGSCLGGLIVCLAMTTACGGSAGSGVDRNKPLTSLNDDEKKKLCDTFATQVDDKLPRATVCQATGAAAAVAVLPLGDIEGACKEAVEECLGEAATPIECDEEALEEFPSCDAKVGTLEDCGADYVTVLSEYLGQFPKCDDLVGFLAKLTVEDIELIRSGPASPASCEALPKECNFPPELQ